jgi:hypothetical protein
MSSRANLILVRKVEYNFYFTQNSNRTPVSSKTGTSKIYNFYMNHTIRFGEHLTNYKEITSDSVQYQ